VKHLRFIGSKAVLLQARQNRIGTNIPTEAGKGKTVVSCFSLGVLSLVVLADGAMLSSLVIHQAS